jgi:hypothetical protein
VFSVVVYGLAAGVALVLGSPLVATLVEPYLERWG